jgi:PhnB protein
MSMTFGESPMAEQTSSEWKDKIIHACQMIGDHALMASDAPPGRYEAAKGMHVHFGVDDPAKAEHIFHALADGGTVTMPIQETFLGRQVRHAGRPVRDALDDQLREGPVI